jgi:hypothetical protein
MSSFSPQSGGETEKLEKYLKSRMWKTADQETRRLFYVACGMSPTEQDSTPPVEQIPCDLFQQIDALWMKYSRGQFGFTAQQSIWQACERKFYDKTEAWNGFGNRVGWRINHFLKPNYWKAHNELTFDLKAPAGHLPHMGKRLSILTVESFMRKLDTCKADMPIH